MADLNDVIERVGRLRNGTNHLIGLIKEFTRGKAMLLRWHNFYKKQIEALEKIHALFGSAENLLRAKRFEAAIAILEQAESDVANVVDALKGIYGDDFYLARNASVLLRLTKEVISDIKELSSPSASVEKFSELAQKIREFSNDERFNVILQGLERGISGRYAIPVPLSDTLKQCIDAAKAVKNLLDSAANLVEKADKQSDYLDWAFQTMKRAEKQFTILFSGLTKLSSHFLFSHLLDTAKELARELGALTSELWRIAYSESEQRVGLHKSLLLSILKRYLSDRD